MSNLQEAFREAARREFAAVPDETELDYVFSRKFERRMRRIIRAQVHGYWHMVNTLGKRIAIAAAILVMLLTSVMAIKPIRERVIKFFVEVYEEYFEITFGEEESGDLYVEPQAMTRYTLSWVPEGYIEIQFVEQDVLLSTIWKNQKENLIMLSQGVGIQKTTTDHSVEDIVEIHHGGLLIRHISLDSQDAFVWEESGYIFQLSISERVPLDTALKIIVSLVEK